MREICGKKPGSIKAVCWRKMAGFDPLSGDKFDFNGALERIALIYGLTTEQVEEDLELADVLPVYLDCVGFVNDCVFSRLNELSDHGKKKE